MNTDRMLRVSEIRKRAKDLGLTIAYLADACGIADASLHYHLKKGEVPPKYNDVIRKLFKEETKKQKDGVPKQDEPITIKEMAKLAESTPEKPTPKEPEPFILPSIADVLGMEKPDAEYLDNIRKEIHIPGVFLSKALGKHQNWWSGFTNGRESVTDKDFEQIKQVLTTLLLIFRQVNPFDTEAEEVDSEWTDTVTDVVSALHSLQDITRTIQNRIDRKVASTYISTIIAELEGLTG